MEPAFLDFRLLHGQFECPSQGVDINPTPRRISEYEILMQWPHLHPDFMLCLQDIKSPLRLRNSSPLPSFFAEDNYQPFEEVYVLPFKGEDLFSAAPCLDGKNNDFLEPDW